MGMNDITRDRLVSKPPSEAFSEGLAKIDFVDEWIDNSGRARCPVADHQQVSVELFNGKFKYGAAISFNWMTVRKYKEI